VTSVRWFFLGAVVALSVLIGAYVLLILAFTSPSYSASRNSRSENVRVHAVIVAELELGDRHKGQLLGNKPDRQGMKEAAN
jgi:hypothetical protein